MDNDMLLCRCLLTDAFCLYIPLFCTWTLLYGRCIVNENYMMKIMDFFINGALELFRENICIRMVVFFTAALVLLRKFKMNPILVMVLCGVANMLFCAAVGS